jgi:hypothetical protein
VSEQDLYFGLCGIWKAGALGAMINGPKLIEDLDEQNAGPTSSRCIYPGRCLRPWNFTSPSTTLAT